MCEAEFPNFGSMSDHKNMVHGGDRWYQSSLSGFLELQAYVPSPTEKRAVVEQFSCAQQYATSSPEDAPYQAEIAQADQRKLLWFHVYRSCTRFLFLKDNERSFSCPNLAHEENNVLLSKSRLS